VVGRAGSPPGVGGFYGRYLFHGPPDPSSVTDHATPAIYAFSPPDAVPTLLFNPGVAAQTSGQPPPVLGCAGSRVFLLDGLLLHRFLENGEREPDVTLASAPMSSTPGRVLARLETHRDFALVLTVNVVENAIDALFLYADGTVRAFALPLMEGVLPLSTLMSAPDIVNGWLNLLYESASKESPDVRWGSAFNSAYKLPL
jgi:hypothetical protein